MQRPFPSVRQLCFNFHTGRTGLPFWHARQTSFASNTNRAGPLLERQLTSSQETGVDTGGRHAPAVIQRDRRLVLVVLAPVDETLFVAHPSSCPKPQFRMFLLHSRRTAWATTSSARSRFSNSTEYRSAALSTRGLRKLRSPSDEISRTPKPHCAHCKIFAEVQDRMNTMMVALQCQRPALMTDAVRSKPGSRSKPASANRGEYEMDRRRLLPSTSARVFTQMRADHRRILFKKYSRRLRRHRIRLMVSARPPSAAQHRSDADVVSTLPLGEPRNRVKDLIQIRKLAGGPQTSTMVGGTWGFVAGRRSSQRTANCDLKNGSSIVAPRLKVWARFSLVLSGLDSPRFSSTAKRERHCFKFSIQATMRTTILCVSFLLLPLHSVRRKPALLPTLPAKFPSST